MACRARARSGPSVARLRTAPRSWRRPGATRRRSSANHRRRLAWSATGGGYQGAYRPCPARPGPVLVRASRGRARPFGGRNRLSGGPTGRSARRTSPDEMGWRPRTARSSVVLPAPFMPIRPVSSPAASEKDTSRRTSRPDKETVNPSTRRVGSRSLAVSGAPPSVRSTAARADIRGSPSRALWSRPAGARRPRPASRTGSRTLGPALSHRRLPQARLPSWRRRGRWR